MDMLIILQTTPAAALPISPYVLALIVLIVISLGVIVAVRFIRLRAADTARDTSLHTAGMSSQTRPALGVTVPASTPAGPNPAVDPLDEDAVSIVNVARGVAVPKALADSASATPSFADVQATPSAAESSDDARKKREPADPIG